MRRLLIALCAGVVGHLHTVPSASLPTRSGWIPTVQETTNYLLTPGALVGIAINGGIHDISFPFLFAANALFYWVLVYLILASVGRLFSRRPQASVETDFHDKISVKR